MGVPWFPANQPQNTHTHTHIHTPHPFWRGETPGVGEFDKMSGPCVGWLREGMRKPLPVETIRLDTTPTASHFGIPKPKKTPASGGSLSDWCLEEHCAHLARFPAGVQRYPFSHGVLTKNGLHAKKGFPDSAGYGHAHLPVHLIPLHAPPVEEAAVAFPQEVPMKKALFPHPLSIFMIGAKNGPKNGPKTATAKKQFRVPPLLVRST